MELNGFGDELIEKTINLWRDKYACTISREEAISILTTLADLAESLVGWQVDTFTNDAIAEKRAS